MTPSRIVFFTFGKGSGDLVVGISLALAFKRAGQAVQFTAVTNNEFTSISDGIIDHVHVPIEPHLFMVADRKTRLYKTLRRLKPDLLIVYGSWVPILPLLDQFDCSKVLLMRQVNEPFLSVSPGPGIKIDINPTDYDHAFTCEPGFELPGFGPIHPIVIRNHDEILSRDEARQQLGVPDGKKLAVIARNGYEGELEELLARRNPDVGPEGSHKQEGAPAAETPIPDADDHDSPGASGDDSPGDAGDPGHVAWHELITTNKDGGGIFPLADYAAAIDLLVSGGGYSTFYETRYFGIPAELSAFDRNAEDIAWRLRTNAGYTFDVNGADEFVGVVGSRPGQ
jgi:hypothetical protein